MEDLIAEKVLPCWPLPGEAGVQDAVDSVSPEMHHLLEHPQELLHPEHA